MQAEQVQAEQVQAAQTGQGRALTTMQICDYIAGMHGYFSREAGGALAKALGRAPAALLLGPRQCGKSTLAGSCWPSGAMP